MVDFMYTGSYEAPAQGSKETEEGSSEETGEASPAIVFHGKMVAPADKYMISSLHELSLTKFRIAVESEGDYGSLLRSVAEVYTIDADGCAELRRILAGRFPPQLASPVNESVMKFLEEISTITPHFSIDLLKAVLAYKPMGRCESCRDARKFVVSIARCQHCWRSTNFTRVN